jgi:hypothetical protein
MIEISLVFSILSPYLALSVVHGVARSFFAKSYHSPYTAMLLVVIADLFTALLIVPTSSSPYSFKLQSFSLAEYLSGACSTSSFIARRP